LIKMDEGLGQHLKKKHTNVDNFSTRTN